MPWPWTPPLPLRLLLLPHQAAVILWYRCSSPSKRLSSFAEHFRQTCPWQGWGWGRGWRGWSTPTPSWVCFGWTRWEACCWNSTPLQTIKTRTRIQNSPTYMNGSAWMHFFSYSVFNVCAANSVFPVVYCRTKQRSQFPGSMPLDTAGRLKKTQACSNCGPSTQVNNCCANYAEGGNKKDFCLFSLPLIWH